MNDEQLMWIAENRTIFIQNTKAEQLKRDYTYHLYNMITGNNKKPNGCGSCWRNVKQRVYQEYLKQTNIY
jgi:hypothetical protein